MTGREQRRLKSFNKPILGLMTNNDDLKQDRYSLVNKEMSTLKENSFRVAFLFLMTLQTFQVFIHRKVLFINFTSSVSYSIYIIPKPRLRPTYFV
jgi:hypothetical protein